MNRQQTFSPPSSATTTQSPDRGASHGTWGPGVQYCDKTGLPVGMPSPSAGLFTSWQPWDTAGSFSGDTGYGGSVSGAYGDAESSMASSSTSGWDWDPDREDGRRYFRPPSPKPRAKPQVRRTEPPPEPPRREEFNAFFYNPRNMCFCNSLVTCLLSCSSFVDKLTSCDFESRILSELARVQPQMTQAVNDLRPFIRMVKDYSGVVWSSGGQQDPSEFLLAILSTLRDDDTRRQTGLDDLFTLVKSWTCQQCLNCKLDDSDVQGNEEHTQVYLPINTGQEQPAIPDLFQRWLDDKTEENCGCSGGTQWHNKNSQVTASSNVLVLSLRRFIALNKKDETNVQVPTEWTPPGSTRRYHLRSALIHIGPSTNSGHYVSVIHEQGQWYKVDDSYCKPLDIPERDYLLKKSYMLFYDVTPGPVLADSPIKKAMKRSVNQEGLDSVRVNLATKFSGASIPMTPSCYIANLMDENREGLQMNNLSKRREDTLYILKLFHVDFHDKESTASLAERAYETLTLEIWRVCRDYKETKRICQNRKIVFSPPPKPQEAKQPKSRATSPLADVLSACTSPSKDTPEPMDVDQEEAGGSSAQSQEPKQSKTKNVLSAFKRSRKVTSGPVNQNVSGPTDDLECLRTIIEKEKRNEKLTSQEKKDKKAIIEKIVEKTDINKMKQLLLANGEKKIRPELERIRKKVVSLASGDEKILAQLLDIDTLFPDVEKEFEGLLSQADGSVLRQVLLTYKPKDKPQTNLNRLRRQVLDLIKVNEEALQSLTAMQAQQATQSEKLDNEINKVLKGANRKSLEWLILEFGGVPHDGNTRCHGQVLELLRKEESALLKLKEFIKIDAADQSLIKDTVGSDDLLCLRNFEKIGSTDEKKLCQKLHCRQKTLKKRLIETLVVKISPVNLRKLLRNDGLDPQNVIKRLRSQSVSHALDSNKFLHHLLDIYEGKNESAEAAGTGSPVEEDGQSLASFASAQSQDHVRAEQGSFQEQAQENRPAAVLSLQEVCTLLTSTDNPLRERSTDALRVLYTTLFGPPPVTVPGTRRPRQPGHKSMLKTISNKLQLLLIERLSVEQQKHLLARFNKKRVSDESQLMTRAINLVAQNPAALKYAVDIIVTDDSGLPQHLGNNFYREDLEAIREKQQVVEIGRAHV